MLIFAKREEIMLKKLHVAVNSAPVMECGCRGVDFRKESVNVAPVMDHGGRAVDETTK